MRASNVDPVLRRRHLPAGEGMCLVREGNLVAMNLLEMMGKDLMIKLLGDFLKTSSQLILRRRVRESIAMGECE